VTVTANSSPVSASTLTVAGWPAWSEPRSDSPTEISSRMRLRSATTMKPDAELELELLEEALELPTAAGAPPLPDEPVPELPAESAATALPTWPEIEATVPRTWSRRAWCRRGRPCRM